MLTAEKIEPTNIITTGVFASGFGAIVAVPVGIAGLPIPGMTGEAMQVEFFRGDVLIERTAFVVGCCVVETVITEHILWDAWAALEERLAAGEGKVVVAAIENQAFVGTSKVSTGLVGFDDFKRAGPAIRRLP